MPRSDSAKLTTPQSSHARGSNHSGMRAHNERLVLSLIRQLGPMAKVDIARLSGLSAQTVSVIMRALEAEGLLVKGDPVRGKVGQPSVPMGLAPEGAFFLGLKVGRRSVELVLVDFLGRVRDREFRTHAYPTPEATLVFAQEKIAAIMDRLCPSERRRVVGLGIAMPFFLWQWAEHLGVPEQKMASWRDVDLRAEIAAQHDFPVFIQNDASAACVAQVVFGPSDLPRDFLYFYVGYFIGGGVVLNNAVYTGRGNAGALGPMPVPANGTARQLIDVASLSGLARRLEASGEDSEQMWTGTEAWNLAPAILSDWVEEAAKSLASAIISAVSLIDFDTVMIDGGIPSELRQRLVHQTALELEKSEMTGLTRPDVRQGTIGPDARAIGAASLPLSDRYLADQNSFKIVAAQ